MSHTSKVDLLAAAAETMMTTLGAERVDVDLKDEDGSPAFVHAYRCNNCENVHVVVEQHRWWDSDAANDRTLRRLVGEHRPDSSSSESPDPQPKGADPHGPDADPQP